MASDAVGGMSRRCALAVAGLVLLVGCQPVRPDGARPDAPAPHAALVAPAADPNAPAPAAPEPEQSTDPAVSPAVAAEIALDVGPPAPARGSDVFARIRRNLNPNACEAGSNSARWRKRYAGHPDAFARHLEQALPLMDFVSVEVERAGLPSEFSFIPLVESWYKPEAIGPGGPAGMWQMISSTARNHAIHIKPGYDGRLSPVQSTRAALSYLHVLQDMFGDWQAVVMAYNAGEGRLQNAFKRARSREVSAAARKPHGLSNITYDYVAKLQALSCLIAEPERSGLRLPLSARFIPLEPVLVGDEYDTVAKFAQSRGLDATALRRLNPGYKSGRIVPDVPRLMLTPRYAVPEPEPQAEILALAFVPTPSASDPLTLAQDDVSPNVHEVRAGDTLWSIARRYGVSVEKLRQLNHLGSGGLVRPGQKLKLAP